MPIRASISDCSLQIESEMTRHKCLLVRGAPSTRPPAGWISGSWRFHNWYESSVGARTFTLSHQTRKVQQNTSGTCTGKQQRTRTATYDCFRVWTRVALGNESLSEERLIFGDLDLLNATVRGQDETGPGDDVFEWCSTIQAFERNSQR